jgi:hypothetical protein
MFQVPSAENNGTGKEPAKKKTVCPVSRKQFREHAKPLNLSELSGIGALPVKEFSTGSLGWYENGKAEVTIDGVKCKVQVGLNVTLVGSKSLPDDADNES